MHPKHQPVAGGSTYPIGSALEEVDDSSYNGTNIRCPSSYTRHLSVSFKEEKSKMLMRSEYSLYLSIKELASHLNLTESYDKMNTLTA